MNRRMANYGNQIVSSYPNRSTSYTPLKPRVDYAKLSDKLSDISSELLSRQQRQKESQIISSLSNLVSSVNSPIKPPPSSVPPQDLSLILSSFQKQQEMMLNMMQNLSAPKANSDSTYTETRRSHKNRRKRKKYNKNESDSDSSDSKQKKGPEEIKKILAELNFDDDGAEDYADQEKKLKFNSNLTDDEKYRLIVQLEKNKRQNVNVENSLKGIRKFRKIGLVVLFPILLVSNMIEKRAKFYAESFRNMEEQVRVFTDVAQSWMIKVMRVTLVSTVNDPDLDLSLTNKESEIRSQTFNTKIIKLQVRINGILEGLENFTNDKEMPGPFRSFIYKLVTDKNYIPTTFLTQFEKTRLDFNEFGGLINMNDDRKKMIICFFFITKILVKNICLRPSDAGIPISNGSKTVNNLKMIGTLFQVIVILNFLKVGRKLSEYTAEEFDYLKRKKGVRPSVIAENNNDLVSDQVFFISEFEVSFNYISPFIEIIRKRLFLWAGKMLDLCEKYRINPIKKK